MTRSRTGAGAPETLRRFGGGPVALFGEMIVVGLAVTALALPLVTLVPALAVGTQHLRRHLAGEGDGLRDLLATARTAVRGGWWRTVPYVAAAAALLLDVALGIRGLVPGGAAVAIAGGVLAGAAILVSCRAAALWRPGASWRAVLREARDVTIADPIGTLLVAVALVVCGTVVWMLPPLVVLTPGMLALALAAVEHRRTARAASDPEPR